MKMLSLFSGVGAFELAGQDFGIETVLSCEIDKYACEVLKKHFKHEVFNDDVRKLRGADIISRFGGINIIAAGFPCQAFSIAGKREGFTDLTRGTLFFEVARLADEIRPEYIFLENVRGLLTHERGKTFGIILKSLDELGYDAEWQILNSKHFGVPQNRERVFIIGHLRGKSTRQIFPIRKNGEVTEQGNNGGLEVQTAQCLTSRMHKMGRDDNYIRQLNNPKHSNDRVYSKDGIGPTLNTMQGGNRQPFIRVDKISEYQGDIVTQFDDIHPCLSAQGGNKLRGIGLQQQDYKIRRLTPIECERLQSFPDNWTNNGQSDTQRYKQMGNSITVNVIKEMFKKLID